MVPMRHVLKVVASLTVVMAMVDITAAQAVPSGRAWTVPAGTELDVRVPTMLDSGTLRLQQRFEAATLVDLRQQDSVLMPAGTLVRGFIGSVQSASRTNRRASLTLAFDEVVVRAAPVRIRATVIKVMDPKARADAGRMSTSAVPTGSPDGLAGVLVAAAGTLTATGGTDVVLPPGTILRLRIASPVEIR